MALTEVRTACYGCHGGCAAIATMDGDRLIKVRPDPEGPLNRGKMCPKGANGPQLLYHPDHLNYPLRRIGARGEGKWERISWDEALDTMAENFRRLKQAHGAKSVAVLTGTGRHLKNQVARFANVLGTPNMASTGASICFGPRINAMMLCFGAYAVTDYYSGTWPGCVLLWGSNPVNSGPDGKMMWNVREAQKHGTKFIVIDPLPTELTRDCALWLKIKPGTDGALALAILHELLENGWYDHNFVYRWTHGLDELRERCRPWTVERAAKICWLDPKDIRQCVQLLRESGPVGLDWGCAPEQSPNAFGAIRAMSFIPALLGSWDVPGGFKQGEDLCPELEPLWDAFDRSDRFGSRFTPCPYAHILPLLRSMKTRDEDRIRAAFIFGTNPLLCVPDARETYEDLLALDFSVCMDQFMTPTAALCDLVLPAASWMEIDNVYSMPAAADHALMAQKKLTRVGERKSDGEVFMALCRRLGLDYGFESTEAMLDSQLAETRRQHPEYADLDLKKLQELGHVQAKLRWRKYETQGRFNTPTGRIELYSTVLEGWGMDPLPDYVEYPEEESLPLVLTTGRRQKGYFISENRQIPGLRSLAPFPRTLIHPKTAEKLGIAEGDWVWIETERGRITQKAELKEGGDPRVVNCQMGWWYPEAGYENLFGWDESNCNLIIPDGILDPIFGDYALRGLRCRVYPNPDGHRIEDRYNQFDKTKWKA